jgi:hypothetical protein
VPTPPADVPKPVRPCSRPRAPPLYIAQPPGNRSGFKKCVWRNGLVALPRRVGLTSRKMKKFQLLALLFGLLLVAAPLHASADEYGDEDEEGEEAGAAKGGDDSEKDVVVVTTKNFDDLLKKHKFALVRRPGPVDRDHNPAGAPRALRPAAGGGGGSIRASIRADLGLQPMCPT